MVGLPGRGKSFISRRIELFLRWCGISTKVFNVGRYRRAVSNKAATSGVDPAAASNRANFFDSSNEATVKLREEAAALALEDLLDWLTTEGQIAVLDATNSREKRRELIWQTIQNRSPDINILFIESVCDDQFMLEENFRSKIKNSPDFEGMGAEEAYRDLVQRIRNYEAQYQTITDDTLSYIRLFNLSSKVACNKIYGRMASSLLPYLMAVNIGTRPIYLVRAGASIDATRKDTANTFLTSRWGSGKVAVLEEEGVIFSEQLAIWVKDRCLRWMRDNGISCPALRQVMSKRLPSFIDKESSGWQRIRSPSPQDLHAVDYHPHDQPLMKIFTSTLPRATNTIKPLGMPYTVCPQLNPLDKGELSRWTLEDVLKHKPAVVEEFKKDAYNFRFPGGESFGDVISRLQPTLIDIESQTCPVLVVSHSSTLTALYSYFSGQSIQQCHATPFPTHHVVELIPVLGGSWIERRFEMRQSEGGGMAITQAGTDRPLTERTSESANGMPMSIFPEGIALT